MSNSELVVLSGVIYTFNIIQSPDRNITDKEVVLEIMLFDKSALVLQRKSGL